jgi:hypothetical protein
VHKKSKLSVYVFGRTWCVRNNQRTDKQGNTVCFRQTGSFIFFAGLVAENFAKRVNLVSDCHHFDFMN